MLTLFPYWSPAVIDTPKDVPATCVPGFATTYEPTWPVLFTVNELEASERDPNAAVSVVVCAS